jgi:hypothetical protein
MQVKEQVLARLDALIRQGEDTGRMAVGQQKFSAYHQWTTSSKAFLEAKFGDHSQYMKGFLLMNARSIEAETLAGVAFLKAAKNDVEADALTRIEGLVSADMFSDFLEMAEHLQSEGFKDPAAMLAGAVLEEHLRRLCKANGIAVKSKDDINALNTKLADRPVYNRIQQRAVAALAAIRNSAAHGKFGDYTAEDVTRMLAGVQSFLAATVPE